MSGLCGLMCFFSAAKVKERNVTVLASAAATLEEGTAKARL